MPDLQSLMSLFTAHGYLAVFGMLLACGLGLPVPEDITLVAGGIVAGLGHADVRIMTGVGLAGVLVGDSIMFLVGRLLGERVLGHRLFARVVTVKRYVVVRERFARHGLPILFAARFMPGMRAVVFITAGMTRQVGLGAFWAADGLAALVSVPVWVGLGFVGADNRDWLMDRLARLERGTWVVFGVVLLVGAGAWLHRRGRAARQRGEE